MEWNRYLSHQQPFARFPFMSVIATYYSWDCLTATTAQENAGTNWKRCTQYKH